MELRKSRRKRYCNASLQQPYPIFIESELGISLENWVPIICTGKFNGLGVAVENPDEMNTLYSMGFFGKGSLSRSTPKILGNSKFPPFIRHRQYLRRKMWYEKYKKPNPQDENGLEGNVTALDSAIGRMSTKNVESVIELSSSDDDVRISDDLEHEYPSRRDECRGEDEELEFPPGAEIVLPDSDNEREDYFENLQPFLHIDKNVPKENLILGLQESFFLAYGLGCLQIRDSSNNPLSIEESWQLFCTIQTNFPLSYAAYHYFRAKGYVVKSGLKFGGDFLLYRDGPPFYHADYVTIVESVRFKDFTLNECNPESEHDWISLQAIMRMASTAFKEIIITQVVIPDDLEMKDLNENPDLIKNLTVNELLVRRGLQEKD